MYTYIYIYIYIYEPALHRLAAVHVAQLAVGLAVDLLVIMRI